MKEKERGAKYIAQLRQQINRLRYDCFHPDFDDRTKPLDSVDQLEVERDRLLRIAVNDMGQTLGYQGDEQQSLYTGFALPPQNDNILCLRVRLIIYRQEAAILVKQAQTSRQVIPPDSLQALMAEGITPGSHDIIHAPQELSVRS